jgi:hypothetical protein
MVTLALLFRPSMTPLENLRIPGQTEHDSGLKANSIPA